MMTFLSCLQPWRMWFIENKDYYNWMGSSTKCEREQEKWTNNVWIVVAVTSMSICVWEQTIEREKKEKRLDGCVHMMSNACRRHHIGHSTMCTTSDEKKRNGLARKEREKEQMRIELPLGISISSFTFFFSLFSYPPVIDSLCLGNGTSIATLKKKIYLQICLWKKKNKIIDCISLIWQTN